LACSQAQGCFHEIQVEGGGTFWESKAMDQTKPRKTRKVRILKKNPVAKALAQPVYRKRVVPSKKPYKRNEGKKVSDDES